MHWWHLKIFEQKIKDRIARVWGTSPSTNPGQMLSTSEDNKEEKQTLDIAAEPEARYGKRP